MVIAMILINLILRGDKMKKYNLKDIIAKKGELNSDELAFLQRDADENFKRYSRLHYNKIAFIQLYDMFSHIDDKVKFLKDYCTYKGLKGFGNFEDMDLNDSKTQSAIHRVFLKEKGNLQKIVDDKNFSLF